LRGIVDCVSFPYGETKAFAFQNMRFFSNTPSNMEPSDFDAWSAILTRKVDSLGSTRVS
jgi:hypothetical protein